MIKFNSRRKPVLLVLVVMLCVSMIASFTACGQSKANVDTTSADNSTAETKQVESTNTAPVSDVKLSMWHFKVAFDPGFQAAIEQFKAKTGVTIETEIVSETAAYQQKVSAAAAAANLPDLYLWWAGATNGAFDGKAMDMSGELTKDAAWKSNFFPSALDSSTVSQGWIDEAKKNEKSSKWSLERTAGEVYGIPLDVGSFYTVYANAKILKDAGLETKAPDSMEQWIEDMAKIKKATGTPAFVFSVKTFSVYENWFANFVDYMKNGPDSFTKFVNGEEKMSDPKHIHIAKFIEDVTKSEGFIPGVVNLDIDPADQAFAQGKAAYNLGGTFTFASLSAMGMNMDDVISFRVPAYKDSLIPDAKVVPFALTQLIVSAEGKNTKESVDFVKYITSEEGMVAYANAAFDIPSISIKDTSKLNPSITAMLSSLSFESNWWSENAAITNKVFGPEWQAFHDSKQKIILGEMTAQQAAEKFDKDIAAENAKKK